MERRVENSFALLGFDRDKENNTRIEVPISSFGGSMELMDVPKKKVLPTIKELGSTRMEVNVKVKSVFGAKMFALGVVIQIPVPMQIKIGGIIVVDFIDMADDLHKRLIYEEMKKAVERDRSAVNVSKLSRHGLMEITRKRVRPSVTFMISEPCTCCHATGRVEALETTFSKIEHEICRLLVARGFTRGEFEVIPFTDSEKNDHQHLVALSSLRQIEAGNNIPSRKLTLFPVKRWKTSGR